MKNKVIILLLFVAVNCFSQDIRGAYIQTKWLYAGVYSMSVVVLTDPSINIIKPTIIVRCGDNVSETFSLSGSSVVSGVKIVTYSGTHGYAGTGNYQMTYRDSFRVAGIKNYQNSQYKHVYVTKNIFDSSTAHPASSPEITNYPVTYTLSGNQVIYSSRCLDADGDSLSYELTNCLPSPGYYMPSGATIDEASGLFSFSKDSVGLYAFSFNINEWRKNTDVDYILIGTSQVDYVMDITNAVSIKENLVTKVSLKISPNPAADEQTISLHTDKNSSCQVDLYDIMGIHIKTVYTGDILAGDTNIDCDLSALPNSVYNYLINLDGNIYSKKLVKSMID